MAAGASHEGLVSFFLAGWSRHPSPLQNPPGKGPLPLTPRHPTAGACRPAAADAPGLCSSLDWAQQVLSCTHHGTRGRVDVQSPVVAMHTLVYTGARVPCKQQHRHTNHLAQLPPFTPCPNPNRQHSCRQLETNPNIRPHQDTASNEAAAGLPLCWLVHATAVHSVSQAQASQPPCHRPARVQQPPLTTVTNSRDQGSRCTPLLPLHTHMLFKN